MNAVQMHQIARFSALLCGTLCGTKKYLGDRAANY